MSRSLGPCGRCSSSQKGALELGAELPWVRLDSEFSIRLSDLGSIECGLASNDEVFFVSHCNDSLLRSQDASWAEALFPNRVHFFERGGHLGNLHRQDMCKAIARYVDTPSS
jgi:hypothetical protein